MLLSRPSVMGNATPGNNTVFRNGSSAISAGISILLVSSWSLSLSGIIGKKSISSSARNDSVSLLINGSSFDYLSYLLGGRQKYKGMWRSQDLCRRAAK